MADTSTPEALPVYALQILNAITTSDYIVAQQSGSLGDVGLLPVSTFVNTFISSIAEATEIDSSTITLYTSMGWTPPT